MVIVAVVNDLEGNDMTLPLRSLKFTGGTAQEIARTHYLNYLKCIR